MHFSKPKNQNTHTTHLSFVKHCNQIRFTPTPSATIDVTQSVRLVNTNITIMTKSNIYKC